MKRRSRPNLRREIVLVLVGKLLALFVIWIVWFAQPQAPELDARRVGAALYSSQPLAQGRMDSHAQP